MKATWIRQLTVLFLLLSAVCHFTAQGTVTSSTVSAAPDYSVVSVAPILPKKGAQINRKYIRKIIKQWMKQQQAVAKRDNTGRIVLAVLVSLALLFLLLVVVYGLAYAGSGWAAVAAILGLGLIIFLFVRIVRGKRKTPN